MPEQKARLGCGMAPVSVCVYHLLIDISNNLMLYMGHQRQLHEATKSRSRATYIHLRLSVVSFEFY